MGFSEAKPLLFLLLVAALLAVSQGSSIVVGGSQGWRSGYNYTEWAIQNKPFYYGDTLVFKYQSPSKDGGHSVYLLPSLWSYLTCDFRRAKRVANPMQGRGKGFSIALNQWRPYYFASGEDSGNDCVHGLMKFIAIPLPRFHF